MRKIPNLTLVPPEIYDVEGPIIMLEAAPLTPRWEAEAADMLHQIDREIIVAIGRAELVNGGYQSNEFEKWKEYYSNRAAKWGGITIMLAAAEVKEDKSAVGFVNGYSLHDQISALCKMKIENQNLNLVIGIEEDFEAAAVIEQSIMSQCPSIPILSSLEDTCITIAKKIGYW
jgi:hypothetical protein